MFKSPCFLQSLVTQDALPPMLMAQLPWLPLIAFAAAWFEMFETR
jgi:hypothetical protein